MCSRLTKASEKLPFCVIGAGIRFLSKALVGWVICFLNDLDKELDQFADQVKLKGYREVLQSKM